MNATQLLAHFDRLAEAPGAVPRLRRFILDLAVRGKLVEQDAGDEPAAELLERIKEAKFRLSNEGLAKKEKPLPAEFKERPFSIPNSWRWARLQDITWYIQRGKSPNYAVSDGVPVVSQKCVQWRGLDLSSARLITRESLGKYEPVRFLRDQDLLWNSTGTGTIGRIVRVISPPNNLVCDSHVTVVRCALANSEYVRSWLATDHVYGSIEDRAAGATNQVELNSSMAAQQVVPFPPLAEQHRIVAKVDELMALCDQLEAAQQESERRRERLAAASLQRLNQSAADTTPKAQREHARFHLHHLPRLTTRPEHIKAMRQTILNLAVCGRLVRHDVGDESATTLLASIASTKSNLVKAGVIRKTAGLALLSPEDTVFQVPGGWVWERLGTVGYTQTGTTPPTSMPECFGGETPFVTPSDLTASVTTYDGKGLTDIGVRHSRLIAKNSVLMVCIGSTIGKVNVVDREVCCNQQINTLTPVIDGMTGYVAIALRSDYFQKLVITNAGMGTLPILSKGKWEQLPVPIPPLAEQHRIVAKVDELMALCDQLEAQLTITQTDSHRLLEAVLEDALAPA